MMLAGASQSAFHELGGFDMSSGDRLRALPWSQPVKLYGVTTIKFSTSIDEREWPSVASSTF